MGSKKDKDDKKSKTDYECDYDKDIYIENEYNCPYKKDNLHRLKEKNYEKLYEPVVVEVPIRKNRNNKNEKMNNIKCNDTSQKRNNDNMVQKNMTENILRKNNKLVETSDMIEKKNIKGNESIISKKSMKLVEAHPLLNS